MMQMEHSHSFTFNDDGFEVCILCGICSSMRQLKHDYSYELIEKKIFHSIFKYTNK